MDLREFLENVPPGQKTEVEDIGNMKRFSINSSRGQSFSSFKFEAGHSFNSRAIFNYLHTPDIKLFCPNEQCGGVRTYHFNSSEIDLRSLENNSIVIQYICRNCNNNKKIYSLIIEKNSTDKSGIIYKIGEYPQFGSPIPSHINKILGDDKKLFLKGRISENQGLGIGAFVYYRRIVENIKNKLFDEIIKVLQASGTKNDLIQELESAQKETSFTKSFEKIKSELPESLFLFGSHNPIKLLHKFLSIGIHGLTDKECLDYASSIRNVLYTLSSRLAELNKDNTKLKESVDKLINKKK